MSLFRSSYEWFAKVAEKATFGTDSDEEKTKKGVLTIVAAIIAFLAIFWGSAYVALGRPLSGAIPLGYAVISFLSIGYFFLTKRFGFFRFSQLLLILLLPFLLMWSLGGFAQGSVVMVWAFFTPLAAMLFADSAHAVKWLYAFLALTVVSAFADTTLAARIAPIGEAPITVFFVLNMGFGFASIFLVLNYFVKERERSHVMVVEAKRELERSNQQLLENEAKIRELMLTDWLTGVANRRHLDERLRDEIARQQRYGNAFCVIMADLDHFKVVNDTFGHDVGDKVISAFAKTINENVRGVDFVSRYGGEEFLIIMPETQKVGAVQLAERIRIALHTLITPPMDKPVSASFGVTAARPGIPDGIVFLAFEM
jgi:diguanylate cyclase (GGDEF)-like protein